jgi:hypothetical protein
MQKRKLPFAFLTNRIKEAKGLELLIIKPLFKFSIKYYFIAYSSTINYLYNSEKWFSKGAFS